MQPAAILFPGAARSDGDATLEAMLIQMAALQGDARDHTGLTRIAGLYSRRAFPSRTDCLWSPLHAGPDRTNDFRILLERDRHRDELEQMPPVDVFAQQLSHVIRYTPAEYRFSPGRFYREENPCHREGPNAGTLSWIESGPAPESKAFLEFIRQDGAGKHDA